MVLSHFRGSWDIPTGVLLGDKIIGFDILDFGVGIPYNTIYRHYQRNMIKCMFYIEMP
jgi:hypothetical protein